MGISTRGTSSACKSSRGAISTAAEARYAQIGTYPISLADFSGYLDTSNLTASGTGPVVFTGSMRVHSHSDPDGPANMRDAIAVAAHPAAAGVSDAQAREIVAGIYRAGLDALQQRYGR